MRRVQGAMDTRLEEIAEKRTDDNLYDELTAQAGPGGPQDGAFYKVGSVSYQYNKALDEFERVQDGNLATHVSRSCSQDEKTKRLSLVEARLLSRDAILLARVILDQHRTVWRSASCSGRS